MKSLGVRTARSLRGISETVISVRRSIRPFAKQILHFRTRKNLRDHLVPPHHSPAEETWEDRVEKLLARIQVASQRALESRRSPPCVAASSSSRRIEAEWNEAWPSNRHLYVVPKSSMALYPSQIIHCSYFLHPLNPRCKSTFLVFLAFVKNSPTTQNLVCKRTGVTRLIFRPCSAFPVIAASGCLRDCLLGMHTHAQIHTCTYRPFIFQSTSLTCKYHLPQYIQLFLIFQFNILTYSYCGSNTKSNLLQSVKTKLDSSYHLKL